MSLAKWRVATLEGLLNCFLFLQGGLLTQNSAFNALVSIYIFGKDDEFSRWWMWFSHQLNLCWVRVFRTPSWRWTEWRHITKGSRIHKPCDRYVSRSYLSPSGKSMARVCYNHAGLHINESDASFIISFYDIGFIISAPRVKEEHKA